MSEKTTKEDLIIEKLSVGFLALMSIAGLVIAIIALVGAVMVTQGATQVSGVVAEKTVTDAGLGVIYIRTSYGSGVVNVKSFCQNKAACLQDGAIVGNKVDFYLSKDQKTGTDTGFVAGSYGIAALGVVLFVSFGVGFIVRLRYHAKHHTFQ